MITNIERTRANIGALIDKTADAATGVADRAEKVTEKAADDVVDRAHEAGSFVREKVGTTARDLHQHLDDAAEAIDGRYAKARTELSQAASTATSWAASNPRSALFLAASVGFVLGFIAHRRRSLAREST
jgi:ElaB/YqjD/DUF883 family membrane-anchored ribosome-binding protein